MQFLLQLLSAIEGQPMVLESRTTRAKVHGLFNTGVPRACSGKDEARQTQQTLVNALKDQIDAQNQVIGPSERWPKADSRDKSGLGPRGCCVRRYEKNSKTSTNETLRKMTP